MAGVAVLFGLASAPAGATSCLGPYVEHQGEVDRGTTFLVTGRGWGDSCNDAGVPEGEGILGKPITDIEVVISQDGRELVVASGSADWNYNFFVEVEVPADLQPGLATVFARSEVSDSREYDDNQLLLVSDASASPMSSGPVPTFVTSGEPEPLDRTDDDQSWTDYWPAIVTAAGLGVVAGWWGRARRERT